MKTKILSSSDRHNLINAYFLGTPESSIMTSSPIISKIIPEVPTSIAPKTSSIQSVTTKNPYKWANLQEYQDLWSFHITTTPAPRVRS
jgi:hypothetical protein